ncbi:TIGR01906 family membrane protein [Crassaminicella profunda]|uniref:TIGR01906 family membrane protein n=1 Tax=Crassaminicella profunda TaxID=1286698 RepID=UPI001CA668B3|nr:TIGR01906 family membrane protein [Crassaminicella profunda]QZY53661.1 TIGR01906 family membrane protein [Crassaminicella profunda]
MKKINYVCKISQGVMIIFLPIVLLLMIFQAYAFDKDFYLKEFEKYHIAENTKIEQKELDRIADKMIHYLKDEDNNIKIFIKINEKNTEAFGEREKLHMMDVKKLFQKGYLLQKIGISFLVISLILLIKTSEKIDRDIYKSLKGASILSLGCMIFIFVLVQINFYKYFTYFHKIFFDNDLWLLNPKTDLLIQMLPLGFFYDIATKIIVWFMGSMIFLGIVSLYKERYQ